MESDLPLEVLSHILSHLDPQQRLSAGLVCRRWLQASASLLEDVCLTVRGCPRIPVTGRVFPRVTFTHTDINDWCVDFLNRFGPTLLHLRFVECRVRTRKMVVACLCLLTLETTWSNALLVFAALPRLRELNLKHAMDLTDENFAVFDKIAAPNLELFVIPNLMLYEWFYPEDATPPVQRYLSISTLETFVARRAATLTTLHFPKTITHEVALRFSQVADLKLLSVSFASCDERVARVFPEFFRHQPGVIALNVDKMDSLDHSDVTTICHLLPALREFSARQCFCDLESVIPRLLRLRHLRALCLASCSFKSVLYFDVDLTSSNFKFQTLDFSNTQMGDSFIHALLWRTPWLVDLDLRGCRVSDETLNHVCPMLPRLRSLVLVACLQVSDQGLDGIRWLPRLEILDLSFCQRLTSAGVIESVRSLRHLKKLNLKYLLGDWSSVKASLMEHNPCFTSLSVAY